MSSHTRDSVCTQRKPLRAILLGECTVVCDGYSTCTASAPVLELARLLISRGVDPRTPLRIYRGRVLAVRVRTIGVAAGLQINGKGNGFKTLRAVGIAPPIDLNGETHPTPTPGHEIDVGGVS
jgi:hypothetical protein